jgi:hypothetical protein
MKTQPLAWLGETLIRSPGQKRGSVAVTLLQ